MKRIIAVVITIISIVTMMAGCFDTEADKVNKNLSLQAGEFECERKIVVYNALKHEIIMEMEGYMDISNNSHDELVVTCKVGPETYKKNYIYLNQFVLYTVEDITGNHTDPYHYKLIFHTTFPIDIETEK